MGGIKEGLAERPLGQRRRFARNATVSVVIPALNEAANLPYVLPRIPAGYEVILVDGGSQDGTVEVARELCPDVVIVHQARRGKGDALLRGFEMATGDYIVAADADGSTAIEEIPLFIAALDGGADFAKGSRFLPGGGSADLTWLRRRGNSVLVGLVNMLYGTRYTDLCYGYNAFRRDALKHLPKECAGFEIETVMHICAVKAKLTVAEVPSYEVERYHGESNLSVVRDGFRILGVILRHRLSRRPVQTLDGLPVMTAVEAGAIVAHAEPAAVGAVAD